MRLRFENWYSLNGLLLTILLSTIMTGCDNSPKKIKPLKKMIQDTIMKKPVRQNVIPIFGYRFTIEGDFDGDGKKEKLTEHFISGIDKKETNKYESADYGDMVDMTIKKKPVSFVLSDNKKVDTLRIYSGGQLFGISYLKNEGDLNGDGTDEVSYVIDWADWSNNNFWCIVTYKNHKWIELYRFQIWDWQLPDLPEATNQYGLFGTESKNLVNDTANVRLIKELNSFKGLVKKIKNNKIRIIYKTDEADMDTMIVDLRHLPREKEAFN